MEKISVICPVYNTGKYLRRCVMSLLSQTYGNLEIILINDGSTDNSLDICKELKLLDSRIILIDRENGGVSAARNAGLAASTGSLISFIDSDDYIHERVCEILAANMEQTGADLSMCGFQTTASDNCSCQISGRKTCFSMHEVFSHLYVDMDLLFSVSFGKLYRREIIGNICFPIQPKAEDLAFNFDVYKRINKVVYCPDELYCYYQRPDSAVHTFNSSCALDFVEFGRQMDYWKQTGNRQMLRMCFERTYKRYLMTLDCASSKCTSEDFYDTVWKSYSGVMKRHKSSVHLFIIEKLLYLMPYDSGKIYGLVKSYLRLMIYMRNRAVFAEGRKILKC